MELQAAIEKALTLTVDAAVGKGYLVILIGGTYEVVPNVGPERTFVLRMTQTGTQIEVARAQGAPRAKSQN